MSTSATGNSSHVNSLFHNLLAISEQCWSRNLPPLFQGPLPHSHGSPLVSCDHRVMCSRMPSSWSMPAVFAWSSLTILSETKYYWFSLHTCLIYSRVSIATLNTFKYSAGGFLYASLPRKYTSALINSLFWSWWWPVSHRRFYLTILLFFSQTVIARKA